MAGMAGELEFIFRPAVQAIFDHFCVLHGIRIAFYAPDGAELRVGRARSNCRYCRLLRGKLGYEELCRRLDRRKRQEAERSERGLIAYECHGGMTEAIMPVRISGRLLGFVMIGQFRSRRALPVVVLRRSRSRRMAGSVSSAFAGTPYFPAGRVRHVLGLFELLVRFIAEGHMIELKDVIGPVLAHLREHPEERLPLSRAALMVRRSPTTLSHLFRQTLGKSFRQVRTEMALDKADEYLRTVPGIRVAEVAFRLGFDDPLYFSRLYRRYRGVPPSLARNAVDKRMRGKAAKGVSVPTRSGGRSLRSSVRGLTPRIPAGDN